MVFLSTSPFSTEAERTCLGPVMFTRNKQQLLVHLQNKSTASNKMKSKNHTVTKLNVHLASVQVF